MNTRTFATVLGAAFILAGVAGFFPSPIPPDAPPLQMDHGYGLALGLLPVNTRRRDASRPQRPGHG